MANSDDSKKNTDPPSGEGGWVGLGAKIVGMFVLWTGNRDATNTLAKGLKKQCDTVEEPISERKKQIESLPECSIKIYLQKPKDIPAKLKNEKDISCDRDLKNYKCVYQHGETLKQLLGEGICLSLQKVVEEKRKGIDELKNDLQDNVKSELIKTQKNWFQKILTSQSEKSFNSACQTALQSSDNNYELIQYQCERITQWGNEQKKRKSTDMNKTHSFVREVAEDICKNKDNRNIAALAFLGVMAMKINNTVSKMQAIMKPIVLMKSKISREMKNADMSLRDLSTVSKFCHKCSILYSCLFTDPGQGIRPATKKTKSNSKEHYSPSCVDKASGLQKSIKLYNEVNTCLEEMKTVSSSYDPDVQVVSPKL